MLALIALVVAVNLVPENPYYIDAISAWRQGKLLNFNALAHWLSLLWPYALAFGLAIALLPNAVRRSVPHPRPYNLRMSYYQRHVFFCLNERDDGSACCANHNAAEMQKHAKSRIKALDLNGEGKIQNQQVRLPGPLPGRSLRRRLSRRRLVHLRRCTRH